MAVLVLLYMQSELVCHRLAWTRLHVTIDTSDDEEARLPRTLILVGVFVSHVLMALHVAVCLEAMLCMLVLWLGVLVAVSFKQESGRVSSETPLNSLVDALQNLPTT